MANEKLTLETLGELGGGAGSLMINAALNQVVSDTDARGDDGKTRTVKINVTIKKLKNGTFELGMNAGVTVPAYRINPVAGKVKIDHQSKCPVVQFDTEAVDEEEDSKR